MRWIGIGNRLPYPRKIFAMIEIGKQRISVGLKHLPFLLAVWHSIC